MCKSDTNPYAWNTNTDADAWNTNTNANAYNTDAYTYGDADSYT